MTCTDADARAPVVADRPWHCRHAPSLAQLRERIEGNLQEGDLDTAAELFNALPDGLRRPVGILGLLHLFTSMGATFKVERELVTAIRPDGSTRQFLMPAAAIEGSVPDRLATQVYLNEGPGLKSCEPTYRLEQA